MLSHNQRKLILQLEKKKHRLANKLFVAEGKKVVNEYNWSKTINETIKKIDKLL